MIRSWAMRLIVLLAALLAAPGYAAQVNIDIFSVNDFHGALIGEGKNPGIAKLAAVLEDCRAQNPSGTLILAAGDMFQGSMESNMLRGLSVVEQMNYIGFDAACVGNHEFDWGKEVLRRNVQASHFPWLGANVIDLNTLKILAPLKACALFERNGVKIGLIGLCTETTPQATNPKNIDGVYFGGTALAAAYYADQLRQQGADLVILLTHLGSSQNNGAVSGEFEEIANLMGSSVDAVITGHSHAYVNGWYDGTPVLQAGEYGRAVGKLSFVFDTTQRKVLQRKLQLINMNEKPYSATAPDQGSEKLLNSSLREIAVLRNEQLAVAIKPLSHNPSPLRPTVFGEYMCDAVRKAAQADICLLSSGSIRKGLPAGAITYGNFYEAMPIDITMYTLDMYGMDIQAVLEFGINHPSINIVQWSGMTVIYDSRKPYGQAVEKIVLPSGELLDWNKRYRVVTSDFMVNGGGGFVINGINGADSGMLCRDVVKNQLRQDGKIDFAGDGRFVLIGRENTITTPLG